MTGNDLVQRGKGATSPKIHPFNVYQHRPPLSKLSVHTGGSARIVLSSQADQGTCGDCEDGHERAESRKTEIQQWYHPRDNEPDTQQDHAEILGLFHTSHLS